MFLDDLDDWSKARSSCSMPNGNGKNLPHCSALEISQKRVRTYMLFPPGIRKKLGLSPLNALIKSCLLPFGEFL
jgi:hypothetical protein